MSRRPETALRRREWDATPGAQKRRIRRVLFDQQKGICPICARPMIFELTNLDHIRPIARGGSVGMPNLQAVHIECNRLKASGSKKAKQRLRHKLTRSVTKEGSGE